MNPTPQGSPVPPNGNHHLDRLYNNAVLALKILFDAAQDGSEVAHQTLENLAEKLITAAGRYGM